MKFHRGELVFRMARTVLCDHCGGRRHVSGDIAFQCRHNLSTGRRLGRHPTQQTWQPRPTVVRIHSLGPRAQASVTPGLVTSPDACSSGKLASTPEGMETMASSF